VRSLIRLRRAAPEGPVLRRDPAPTRWAYRYQRLMLTPAFRASMRIGLPLALLAFVATAFFTKEANRTMVAAQIDAIKTSVQRRPEFMVRGIEITGAHVSVAGAIQGLVDMEFPMSSFEIDLPALRADVMDLSAVADAVVRIRPGGTLEIAVTEREPVAVWRNTDGLRLIDGTGVMTGMIASRADRPDLPLIAGDGAMDNMQEALALFTAAAPVSDRVRGLVRMGERRWDLVLDRGQRILLPSETPVAALDRVIALHVAQDMLERDIVAVDMRNPDRPTVRLSDLATDQLGTRAVHRPPQRQ